MKKALVFVFISLLLFSLVLAQDEPSLYGDVGSEDVEKIQGVVENYTPINDEGDFDPSKLDPVKSKAEERIDSINSWLENNSPWLKVVFGMVPQISWLFACVLYAWLFLIVNLVFNTTLFGIILDENKSRFLGGALFVVLILTGVVYYIGLLIFKLLSFFWSYLLPTSIISAIIGIVALVIVFIALFYFAPQLLFTIFNFISKNKEKREKEQVEMDRKVLHAQVSKIKN